MCIYFSKLVLQVLRLLGDGACPVLKLPYYVTEYFIATLNHFRVSMSHTGTCQVDFPHDQVEAHVCVALWVQGPVGVFGAFVSVDQNISGDSDKIFLAIKSVVGFYFDFHT